MVTVKRGGTVFQRKQKLGVKDKKPASNESDKSDKTESFKDIKELS